MRLHRSCNCVVNCSVLATRTRNPEMTVHVANDGQLIEMKALYCQQLPNSRDLTQ